MDADIRPENRSSQRAIFAEVDDGVQGARALLAQAVEAEVAEYLARDADRTVADGRRRIVRHGQLPERSIITGIDPVALRQPRVRDRVGADCECIGFSPNIMPRYARRTKRLEALIPILYLKGISTGDFAERNRGRRPTGRASSQRRLIHQVVGKIRRPLTQTYSDAPNWPVRRLLFGARLLTPALAYRDLCAAWTGSLFGAGIRRKC